MSFVLLLIQDSIFFTVPNMNFLGVPSLIVYAGSVAAWTSGLCLCRGGNIYFFIPFSIHLVDWRWLLPPEPPACSCAEADFIFIFITVLYTLFPEYKAPYCILILLMKMIQCLLHKVYCVTKDLVGKDFIGYMRASKLCFFQWMKCNVYHWYLVSYKLTKYCFFLFFL